MSLSVLVKSASCLPNVERFSKSDPMCVITLEGMTTLPESCVYGPCKHFVVAVHRVILLTYFTSRYDSIRMLYCIYTSPNPTLTQP